MHKRTTPKVFENAKELYRNMTPAEVELWARLRAPRKKLIFELDGSQHLNQEQYEAERKVFTVKRL